MIERNAGLRRVVRSILVAIVLIVTLFPLYWFFLTSIKRKVDMFTIPPKFFFDATFEAYAKVFGPEFMETFLNSVITAGFGTVAAVVLGTMSGYAISRFKYAAGEDFMFFVLSTRMLPPMAIMVPLYIMYAELGLSDSHFGMFLVYTMLGLGLSTWIMRGFFDGIPTSVEEAAFVNGYTRWQAFYKIMVPMVKGGIGTAAGISFIFAWNDYTFASILTTRYAKTLPPRIASALDAMGIAWGQIAAAGFLLIIPVVIVFVLIRKHILMGMTFGVLGRAQK